MSTWRYVQTGQPSAPVDTAALQALLTSGALTPETFVWREGMTTWLAAKTLPEFANSRPAAAVPPAVPPVAPPALPAPTSPADDVEQNRAVAIIAYFGILFLVPLLAAPKSRFAKYHANQGLVLFLTLGIAWVGSYVLGLMLLFIPFLGWLLAGAMWLALLLGGVALLVVGIINAAGGHCRPLPLIGHFELIK